MTTPLQKFDETLDAVTDDHRARERPMRIVLKLGERFDVEYSHKNLVGGDLAQFVVEIWLDFPVRSIDRKRASGNKIESSLLPG